MIDWNDAPEGATHYMDCINELIWIKVDGDSIFSMTRGGVWKKSVVAASEALKDPDYKPILRPKTLTQAAFDGLPPEYKFAVIDSDEGGLAFAAVGRPKIEAKGDFLFWQKAHGDTNAFIDIGWGYDTHGWTGSLIERETVNPVSEQQDNTTQDAVKSPSHYTTGGIECIDAMQAMLSREEFIGYLRGNVFKYQWRYQHKNGVEDLRKAQWYANRLIELESAK